MYSDASIVALSETVSFDEYLREGCVVLDEENINGSSGLLFSDFHEMITTDALLCTFKQEISLESAELNRQLTQFRTAAAKRVLVDILDSNICYEDNFDYSGVIECKLNLLREPFGYAVVIKCMQMMMSSGRYNIHERTVKQTYAILKLELEGAKNAQGQTVSQGIVSKYRYTVKNAAKVIFKIEPAIQKGQGW